MLTDLDYERLSAYIDGAITDSERIAFELRLQAEPELRRDRKSTRLNSSHLARSRMPSSA